MNLKILVTSEIIGYRVESSATDNYTFYKDFSQAVDELSYCKNAVMYVTVYFCISGKNHTHDIKIATVKDGELTINK